LLILACFPETLSATQGAQRLEGKSKLSAEIDGTGGCFTGRLGFGHLLIFGGGIIFGGIVRLRRRGQDENTEQCQTSQPNARNHGCSFAKGLRLVDAKFACIIHGWLSLLRKE
jgi:hypothetical protein